MRYRGWDSSTVWDLILCRRLDSVPIQRSREGVRARLAGNRGTYDDHKPRSVKSNRRSDVAMLCPTLRPSFLPQKTGAAMSCCDGGRAFDHESSPEKHGPFGGNGPSSTSVRLATPTCLSVVRLDQDVDKVLARQRVLKVGTQGLKLGEKLLLEGFEKPVSLRLRGHP
jgi:hypothetical protein